MTLRVTVSFRVYTTFKMTVLKVLQRSCFKFAVATKAGFMVLQARILSLRNMTIHFKGYIPGYI